MKHIGYITFATMTVLSFALVNCAGDKADRPTRVSPSIRYKIHIPSADEVQREKAELAKQRAEIEADKRAKLGGESTDGNDGATEDTTNGNAKTDTNGSDKTLPAEHDEAEVRTPTCRIAGDTGLQFDELGQSHCDGFLVKTDTNGNLQIAVRVGLTNLEPRKFKTEEVNDDRTANLVSAVYNSSLDGTRAPDGRNLVQLTHTLPNKRDLIDATTIEVKLNNEKLEADDFDITRDDTTNLFVRILNVEKIKNINFELVITYKLKN